MKNIRVCGPDASWWSIDTHLLHRETSAWIHKARTQLQIDHLIRRACNELGPQTCQLHEGLLPGDVLMILLLLLLLQDNC